MSNSLGNAVAKPTSPESFSLRFMNIIGGEALPLASLRKLLPLRVRVARGLEVWAPSVTVHPSAETVVPCTRSSSVPVITQRMVDSLSDLIDSGRK